MSLYESNYLRLAQLAGPPRALEGSLDSVVVGDCDLLLKVTERTPYTTTLQLTYLMHLGPGREREPVPDLSVRVYHDARLAEVLAGSAAHANDAQGGLRGRAVRELEQRWARNMMLNKWLDYCVERGHSLRLPRASGLRDR